SPHFLAPPCSSRTTYATSKHLKLTSSCSRRGGSCSKDRSIPSAELLLRNLSLSSSAHSILEQSTSTAAHQRRRPPSRARLHRRTFRARSIAHPPLARWALVRPASPHLCSPPLCRVAGLRPVSANLSGTLDRPSTSHEVGARASGLSSPLFASALSGGRAPPCFGEPFGHARSPIHLSRGGRSCVRPLLTF